MQDPIVFLHIGKTGGTAARGPVRQHLKKNEDVIIELPGHKIGLPEIVEEANDKKVIFFIREPVSRFVSGFNSRLRAGWPRFSSQLSPNEETVFAVFKTPSAIAEALSSPDPEILKTAKLGMKAIRHAKWAYQHYLGSIALLEREKSRILFIGEQEQFDSDFEMMKKILNMAPELMPATDDVKAHKTPEGYDQTMSDLGRRNLETFYAEDLKIYAWCKAYREELVAKYTAQFASNV